MTDASEGTAKNSSLQRFNDYLNGLKEEFEHQSNAKSTKHPRPSRFNTYIVGLKVEFELMALEVESLQNERDEYKEKIEMQARELQNIRRDVICERCSKETMTSPRTVAPSPAKTTKISLFSRSFSSFQSKLFVDKRRVDLTQESTSYHSTQATTLITKSHSATTAINPSHAPSRSSEASNPSLSQWSASDPKESIIFNTGTQKDPDARVVTLHKNPSAPSGSVFPPNEKSVVRSDVNQPKTTIVTVPPQSPSLNQPSIPSVDELVQLRQPDWSVAYNPEVQQALSISHLKTFNFTAPVCCVKFSPDGKCLAIGLSGSNDGLSKTHIYDVEKGLQIGSLTDLYVKEIGSIIWCVQFSPDNKYIATACSDRRIRLWGIAQKRTRASFGGHNVSANTISFSPNGRFLASGDGSGGVQIWSLRDGSSKILINDVRNIFSVIFSPNGRYIASLSITGWLRIWEARTGQLLDAWKGHPEQGFCAAFSPDGKGLVSGGKDGSVRYWDTSSLAAMGTGRGRVKNGAPGERFPQIGTFKGHTAYLRSIAFSPDNRWVVSGSEDESVRIWDPDTATWQCTLLGHTAHVRAVDFSPAGNYLASGSGGHQPYQVALWRYKTST